MGCAIVCAVVLMLGFVLVPQPLEASLHFVFLDFRILFKFSFRGLRGLLGDAVFPIMLMSLVGILIALCFYSFRAGLAFLVLLLLSAGAAVWKAVQPRDFNDASSHVSPDFDDKSSASKNPGGSDSALLNLWASNRPPSGSVAETRDPLLAEARPDQ